MRAQDKPNIQATVPQDYQRNLGNTSIRMPKPVSFRVFEEARDPSQSYVRPIFSLSWALILADLEGCLRPS